MLMTSYLRWLYPAFQVDFQRPVAISKVATQGAKHYFAHHFVQNYTISYSTDKKKWIYYKGDSDAVRKASDYFCVVFTHFSKLFTLNMFFHFTFLLFSCFYVKT